MRCVLRIPLINYISRCQAQLCCFFRKRAQKGGSVTTRPIKRFRKPRIYQLSAVGYVSTCTRTYQHMREVLFVVSNSDTYSDLKF